VIGGVTDAACAEDLFAQARRCRRLSHGVDDVEASDILERLAVDYEARAQALRAGAA
jgi:hypothetical protein